MQETLTHPYFKNIFVPVGAAALTIFIKAVSKSENQKFIEKKDFAIGLELCVTSLTVFSTGMVDVLDKYSSSTPIKAFKEGVRTGNLSSQAIQDVYGKFLEFEQLQEKISVSWWIALALSIGTFSIAFLIRKRGWTNQNNQFKISLWTGIVIPNILGLMALICTVAWTGV